MLQMLKCVTLQVGSWEVEEDGRMGLVASLP